MGKMKKTAYLAGPMELAKDSGENWRHRIKKDLEELGYKVIDPSEEENAPEIHAELHKCKEHGLWDRFKEIVNAIIERDRGYVLTSDLIILRWDTGIKSYGSSDELRWALDNKIPVYSVVYGPVGDESSWAMCKIHQTRIFDSFTKLIEELKNEKV